MESDMKWFSAVALAVLASGSAQAADLGGDCCADLEERVAELEATTARKGNRKVSLTVYGQVNAGILWLDVPGDNSGVSDAKITQNGVDPTYFGLRGEGKISEGYKGGFVIEVDLRQLDVGGSGVFDNASPRVKQSYVYLSTPVGKVSLGKTGQATSGFDEIDLSNTSVAAKTLSIQPLADHLLTGADVPWIDGTERNVVRYDSPSIAGFVASASWGSAAGGENTWDVALRYAGEFQQIKVAGGVGYRHDEDVAIDLLDITQISIPTGGRDTFLVAGSLYHTPTGLFITAEWADQDWDLGLDTKGWHVKGGIEPKLTSIGRTSFYGEYGDMKLDAGGPSLDVKVWGVGIVQAIDASALDLYASYRDYDLEGESIGQFLAGARIKF
jgi:hypothetical protein